MARVQDMTTEELQAELLQIDPAEGDWSVAWIGDANVYVTRHGDDFYVSRLTPTENVDVYSGDNAYTAAVRIMEELEQLDSEMSFDWPMFVSWSRPRRTT